MSGHLDCFGATHVGRARAVNEDQFLIADLNKSMRLHQTSLGLEHQTRLFGNSQGKLLLVADGMGGQEAGERASQLAVDSLVSYVLNTLHWYFQLDGKEEAEFEKELQAALQHCHAMLQLDADAIPQRRGMGTTLTMAYIIWPRMYVVHVGDSRCYLLRSGKLEQLTRDHTLRQLRREAADAAGQESRVPQGRDGNLLWNTIGASDEEPSCDVQCYSLQLDDTILLCTDGLTRHIDDTGIRTVLSGTDSAEMACTQLIEEANKAGGSDNITAVIGQFNDRDTTLDQDHAMQDTSSDDSTKEDSPSPTPANREELPASEKQPAST